MTGPRRASVGRPPGRPFVFVLAALACVAACGRMTAPDKPPRIALSIPGGDPASAFVEVRDLPVSTLARLRSRAMSRDEWTTLLRVTVAAQHDVADRPAVAGAYEVTADGIRFTPRFPFDAGREYEVRFDPSRANPGGAEPSSPIVQKVSIPKLDAAPSTVVDVIYPTAETLPENQLRFYVMFSAPMGLKGGLDYLHLLDDRDREVKDPFLPLDAEFWNGDRTRYTVFVDPGRVKRGVLPNEQMGPSFERGRIYTIVVDREWRDAQGLPLKDSYRQRFRVGPPDTRPLDPASWTITAPAAGTRDALAVTFPEPLDHGLLNRAMGVAGRSRARISGDVAIDRHETRWRFTPQEPWRAGEYRVVVLTILEDLAGNRIGRAFEVDRFDRVDRTAQAESIELPFRIAGSTP
jgi:hypothetical protein